MTTARLGFEIDSSQAPSAAVDLDRLTVASEKAERASEKLSTATGRGSTATGQLAAALSHTGNATAQMERSLDGAAMANMRMETATRSATAAIHAQGVAAAGAVRLTRQQMMGLGYQINDVATMLLMGASPFQILASQGGQVYQVLGDGPEGVRGSLRAVGTEAVLLAGRLAPIGIAVGAIGFALLGMQQEINKTSAVTVSFGDVALAVWQTIRDGIIGTLQPAINGIAGTFTFVWDHIKNGVPPVVNLIINSFRAAAADIKFAFEQVPNIVGAAAIGAANAVINAIEGMLNATSAKFNEWIGGMNARLPEAFKIETQFSPVEFGNIDNPYAAALGAAVNERNATISAIMSSNPMGAFFDQVSTRATENALAGVEDAATGAGGAIGRAANDNRDPWKGLRGEVEETGGAMEQVESWAQSIGSTIANTLRQGGNLWDAFKQAGIDAFAKIGEAMLTSGIQDLLGGLVGGAGGGGLFSSLFSWLGFAKGAAFQAGNVVPFAGGGVVSSPTAFPMSGGRTGLMGEAGPEAIMPLARGRNGKLGVVANQNGQAASQSVRVENHFHITGAVSSDDVQRMVQHGSQESVRYVKEALPTWQFEQQTYGRAS